jgi:hypothetical protein
MSFARTPLHCALALITHTRHAAFGLGLWIQWIDWAGRRLAPLLACARRRTGWPKVVLFFFGLPEGLPFTTSQVHTHGTVLRAILAQLPGRQYQRDAPKHRLLIMPAAHSNPHQSVLAVQQWWRAGTDAAHPGLARCVYWNFILVQYYGVLLLLLLLSFLRAACNATPDWRRAAPTRSRHAGPHSHLRGE